MVLVGRVLSARAGVVSLSDDLGVKLAAGDEAYAGFVQAADAHTMRVGLALPDEPGPAGSFPEPVSAIHPIMELNLGEAGINSVIWATGYRYAFGWVDLGVFAQRGDPPERVPIHQRSVTGIPGAYFLGLPLLHKTKSSFLSGVGEDAAYLAEQIAAR